MNLKKKIQLIKLFHLDYFLFSHKDLEKKNYNKLHEKKVKISFLKNFLKRNGSFKIENFL